MFKLRVVKEIITKVVEEEHQEDQPTSINTSSQIQNTSHQGKTKINEEQPGEEEQKQQLQHEKEHEEQVMVTVKPSLPHTVSPEFQPLYDSCRSSNTLKQPRTLSNNLKQPRPLSNLLMPILKEISQCR